MKTGVWRLGPDSQTLRLSGFAPLRLCVKPLSPNLQPPASSLEPPPNGTQCLAEPPVDSDQQLSGLVVGPAAGIHHAAMDAGCASADEAGELLVAVYRRLSEALSPVRGRYDPNYP